VKQKTIAWHNVKFTRVSVIIHALSQLYFGNFDPREDEVINAVHLATYDKLRMSHSTMN
jgi:hypothetical protein